MKAARILVALMFIIGGIGVFVNGAALYSRFLFVSILLVVFAWTWTRWVTSGLKLERTSRELRANVGDVFEESYKLQNATMLPAPWIEIANQTRIPYAAGSRLLTLVLGRQRRSYNARSWLTQRGSFQLGPTRITTGDPDRLCERLTSLLGDHELREAMGHRAVDYSANYAWEKIATQIIDVYKEVTCKENVANK